MPAMSDTPSTPKNTSSYGAVSKITNSKLKTLVITDTIEPTEAVKAAKNIRVLSMAPLLGAAIVRLNEAWWSEVHAMLEGVGGLDSQIAVGVVNARTAYDDPGTLLMRLRMEEPEDFAACAGAGVQGLVPDLADFWTRYLIAARDGGEIHPATDIAEASEWVARVIISLVTVPGDVLDPNDRDAVRTHVRRYVMPGLQADPSLT